MDSSILHRNLDSRNASDEPKTFKSGRYPARVTSVQEGETILWHFEILTGDFSGKEIEGETDKDLSPDSESEARDWIENILRRPLEEGEHVDLSRLEGERCEIQVRTSFNSPSVWDVYGASLKDPEAEEARMLAEVDRMRREDPFGVEFAKRLRDLPSPQSVLAKDEVRRKWLSRL